MGTLSRIGLANIVQRCNLDVLVETGTGHGHSLFTALQCPELFEIHSIEIDYETYHRARVGFMTEPRIVLHYGDSVVLLREIAASLSLQRRVLWFLDAHFPGSGRLAPTPMVMSEGAVPLRAEFDALAAVRNLTKDVVVVDDLCLFEEGTYESDSPELRAAINAPSLAWLDDEMSATHTIRRLTRDGGYWIALPK